ncbi:hypothetical protein Vafri_11906 [Volvox africanus]|uniref:Uncharacterized protein n=1 Tax=Volvox africanus TaxID=51714 RepID=A0A8J4F4U6_9CHLO|nr:hypothetical protein Vafri_11906 [Volvox africanus]
MLVLHWVAVVHAINLGSLHEDVSIHLCCTQRRCGVRGEERIARSRTEDDDAALIQVSNGSAPNVRFRNLAHFNGGLDTCLDAHVLQCALQQQCVHDCGQHSHVVGLCPIHSLRCCRATEIIAATNYHRQLQACIVRLGNLFCYQVEHRWVDTEALLALQSLAAYFKKYPRVLILRPTWNGGTERGGTAVGGAGAVVRAEGVDTAVAVAIFQVAHNWATVDEWLVMEVNSVAASVRMRLV